MMGARSRLRMYQLHEGGREAAEQSSKRNVKTSRAACTSDEKRHRVLRAVLAE